MKKKLKREKDEKAEMMVKNKESDQNNQDQGVFTMTATDMKEE